MIIIINRQRNDCVRLCVVFLVAPDLVCNCSLLQLWTSPRYRLCCRCRCLFFPFLSVSLQFTPPVLLFFFFYQLHIWFSNSHFHLTETTLQFACSRVSYHYQHNHHLILTIFGKSTTVIEPRWRPLFTRCLLLFSCNFSSLKVLMIIEQQSISNQSVVKVALWRKQQQEAVICGLLWG